MPIYEYECSQCHETSDALQKVNDPPPETCPRCGAQNTLSRLLSRTSFVLKGGGWYADLYSSSKPKADGGESKPAAKTEGSGGGTSAPEWRRRWRRRRWARRRRQLGLQLRVRLVGHGAANSAPRSPRRKPEHGRERQLPGASPA